MPTECHRALFGVLGGEEPTEAVLPAGPRGPAKAMALAQPGALQTG